MTLLSILIGTLAAGVGSVWLAALLSFGALGRYTQHMLSMAAGALLATAFMHLLPEAFESGLEPHDLFLILLVGLVFFFLLDKAELWHHGHEHHHEEDHHGHDHGHDHASHGHSHSHAPKGGSWAVLAGDSVHCFGDGMLIASAFIADLRLGAIAALAVLAHEVPHHMGDLMVLRTGTSNKRAALIKGVAGRCSHSPGWCAGLLVSRPIARLPAVLPGGGFQQLYLRSPGGFDSAVAEAAVSQPDRGADCLAGGGHCAGVVHEQPGS